MPKEKIIANCYAFLLAGYETTSTALAYTAWLLAKHESVQQRLQLEIDTNFPKSYQVHLAIGIVNSTDSSTINNVGQSLI